ncbi:MAG TPA: aminotransferase class III-fold pyridoxal phosphate-dependent enzyme, partial [Planctomycetia bacterium]|nr:aminotransferase class III-fold pyridoxal phosphate-dependent enzyme [Planctomycetia bacterium]
RFISFPKAECADVSLRGRPFDGSKYEAELEGLWSETGGRIACLITEPYLGGGGSFHPPHEYQQLLVRFCRAHEIPFILDEVQANFGRTGEMYAFETYGIEPDIVVLGKGMGNGVPVNAAAGRADLFHSLGYGGGSDTWSGHPLGCAAVLATLDCFENFPVLAEAKDTSAALERGLVKLKEIPIVAAVRGEAMVWGIELAAGGAEWPSSRVANECVRRCYLGTPEGEAIHLLGPLSGNVIRVAPPLTTTVAEAEHWTGVMHWLFGEVAKEVAQTSK